MNEMEVRQGLTEIFRETFDDPTLVLDEAMTADDIADWDSARMVELIMAAESRFGIRFTTRETDSLRCVGDFLSLIQRKLAA